MRRDAAHRRFAVLLVLLLAAVPLAGCLEALPYASGPVGQTWTLEATGLQEAQEEMGLTGEDVKVAIVDTGLDPDHPEFDGVDIVAWKDYVQGRSSPYDDNGHGTHVAGIIAAQGRTSTLMQGYRLQGAAPGVDLIPIKAIGANGQGQGSDVARGVDYARNQGADVIVLSLGGGSFPVLGSETENAVNRAVDRGILVVAAAGNQPDDQDSCDGVMSPGNVRGAITVGAVTEDLQVADYSCRGNDNDPNQLGVGGRSDPHKKPELVAPGDRILSTWAGTSCGGSGDGADYCQASGTSQAVPFVAGALALLLEDQPDLQRDSRSTVNTVKDNLMTTTENIGPLGDGASAHHDAYGYGLLRADRLVTAMR